MKLQRLFFKYFGGNILTQEEILGRIIEICKKNQVKEVILFGSRAKGTAHEKSDFDIAVSGVKDIEDLREQIEEIPTLYSFDIVDLDECKNQLLKEDIALYGRKIL